jgi:hypothetical protein
MSEEKLKELKDIIMSELPDTIVMLGYLENALDIQAKLIQDLFSIVDQTKITADIQARLDVLNRVLTYSSIDFTSLNGPLMKNLIDTLVETKEDTRILQGRYFKAQIESGILKL